MTMNDVDKRKARLASRLTYGEFAVDAVLRPILVWPFDRSPEDLQDLCNQGGDEDWIALVSAGQDEPSWIWLNGFGCCGTYKYKLGDGSMVYVGTHA